MGISVLVLLAGIVLIGFIVVGIYNGLVTARNAYKNAFAQIDVQLNRRYDLIPNLGDIRVERCRVLPSPALTRRPNSTRVHCRRGM